MSWGTNNNCYGCLNTECVDRKMLETGIYDVLIYPIHINPEHSAKGGWGNITINCGKKEVLQREADKATT